MGAVLEWTGCIMGLAGSLVLATNTRYSPLGWVFYLAANLAMILFAMSTGLNGLLVQQSGFMAITLFALHRNGLLKQLFRKVTGYKEEDDVEWTSNYL